MICRIADLTVEIPETGGMASRCQAYLTGEESTVDIRISEGQYKLAVWEDLSYDLACYMESGYHFYANLLRFSGMLLHSSALEYGGRAYLFSGPSTVGKSTHTRQWQKTFGADVRVFNDDKPALRCVEGQWYAYGTPWCGKDGINENRKVPLAGICFLKQARENRIRRLTAFEAVGKICSQTVYNLYKQENMDRMLSCVDALVQDIPVWELENFPGEEAVRLAWETMVSASNN